MFPINSEAIKSNQLSKKQSIFEDSINFSTYLSTLPVNKDPTESEESHSEIKPPLLGKMAPAHARAAATHEDNLKKLCVMCGLSKPGKMKPSVYATLASDIRDIFKPDFDTESLLMPTGICTKHSTLLYRIKNKQKSL